jgi:ElaB/YqjD/DUF883 family membrane-anchored ribosome-binding protein
VDGELEVIRGEMEETRANLANKLEALETQVRETVSSASETVTTTVEGVKDVVETVSDTVGTVTDTFNISKQVEEHPWIAMGIAVAAGFMAGQMLGGGSSQPAQPQPAPQPSPPPTPSPSPPQPALEQIQAQQPSQQNGIFPSLESLESLLPDMNGVLGTALTGVNSLAIGTVMGVVREVVANGLPLEWKSELTKMVDQMTTQLGGKPLQAQQREDDKESREPKDEGTTAQHNEPMHESEDKANRRKRNNRNPVSSQV